MPKITRADGASNALDGDTPVEVEAVPVEVEADDGGGLADDTGDVVELFDVTIPDGDGDDAA